MSKVELVTWIVFGVFVIFLLTCIYLLFKYKKEGKIAKEEKVKRILLDLSYYAVAQAEFLYRDGNGKQKLQFAIRKVKSQMPSVLSFFISEEMIINSIEYALNELQLVFKSHKQEKEDILNKIIETATKSQDINTLKVANELKNSNGYIEAFGEARTNFHGDTEAAAGIRAGMKL